MREMPGLAAPLRHLRDMLRPLRVDDGGREQAGVAACLRMTTALITLAEKIEGQMSELTGLMEPGETTIPCGAITLLRGLAEMIAMQQASGGDLVLPPDLQAMIHDAIREALAVDSRRTAAPAALRAPVRRDGNVVVVEFGRRRAPASANGGGLGRLDDGGDAA